MVIYGKYIDIWYRDLHRCTICRSMIACGANLPLSSEVYPKKKKKKKTIEEIWWWDPETTVSRATNESFRERERERERKRIPSSCVTSINFVRDIERSWSVICRSVTGLMMLRTSEINCEAKEESMIGATKRARWSLRVLVSRKSRLNIRALVACCASFR